VAEGLQAEEAEEEGAEAGDSCICLNSIYNRVLWQRYIHIKEVISLRHGF
jgi:hypothetical protein